MTRNCTGAREAEEGLGVAVINPALLLRRRKARAGMEG
jgi:hypothetical protein